MLPERLPFRADLEGLRGVAILLVVLFHAGVPALAGGFVGVDVFFVLSGFFITGLLLREREETGEVRLADFYGRRALRLMPAFVIVLVVTLFLVMTLYAPIDRPLITSSARAVAVHAGNVEFARTATDYFSSADNPLLHTWSLAVEEQFYLVWPIVFVLAVLLHDRCAGDARDGSTRKSLVVSFAFLAACSFGASLWLTTTAPGWAFYVLPARLWEFALGGLLALTPFQRFERVRVAAGALQIGGIIAIAYAALHYTRATPYPGAAALLPAAGAFALILGGAWSPVGVVSRALAQPLFRWLGRLSYGWYLWHWPLVGFGAVIDPSITVFGRLAWSGVALVFAWLTHRFVERPFRAGAPSRLPLQWVAPAALVASVCAALVSHAALRASERQVAEPGQRALAAAREDRVAPVCWSATVERATHRDAACQFGDPSANATIILFGDSHAQHWLAGLDLAGRQRGWKVVPMVKGGCPVADVSDVDDARLGRYYRECNRYREAMLRTIVAMRPTAVILSSWDHYTADARTRQAWQLSPDAWRRGLRRTYARLAAAGVHTIVLRDVPHLPFDAPSCLSRRAARLPFANECTYELGSSLSRTGVDAQDAAARGLPVRIVDMNDRICDTPRCAVVQNGNVEFTDDNHLTATFSRALAPTLGARVAGALLTNVPDRR